MGKTPKVTVWEDFSYILKKYLHEKFAKQLSKEVTKGNIRFQVIRDMMVKPILAKEEFL